MLEPQSLLASGAVLGLSAGIAPGPLLTLVVTETLRHSAKQGIQVALAPILTDLPIILASLFLLAKLSDFHSVLGVVSLLGGCYLLYLGYESLSLSDADLDTEAAPPDSLKKGVVTNFLNPHPYLFWITVGGPLLLKGSRVGSLGPALFIAGFYTCIIGAKVGLALLVARFGAVLRTRAYTWTMRVLGLALAAFGLLFFRDGWRLLTG